MHVSVDITLYSCINYYTTVLLNAQFHLAVKCAFKPCNAQVVLVSLITFCINMLPSLKHANTQQRLEIAQHTDTQKHSQICCQYCPVAFINKLVLLLNRCLIFISNKVVWLCRVSVDP